MIAPADTPTSQDRWRGTWRTIWASENRPLTLALAAALAFGLWARFWIYTGGLGEVNADEALIGLMAMHFLDGEFSSFFWGQHYGGTLDVLLSAPLVALLGSTRTALQVVPFLQSVAATLLVGAVCRRILGRRSALTAAAIFWSFPAAFVWWQTRSTLLYLPTVVFGLIIVLCTQRIEEEPTRRVDWLILGLVAGLGWWTSPHILYFLLPSALWLLSRRSLSVLRQGWIALPAFVAGAMPWLAYNITSGWLSVTDLPNSTDGPLDRLVALVLGGLPISLGAKVPFTEEWIGPVIGPLIYVVGLAAIITACNVRRTSRPLYLWLLIAFPILFISVPAEAYVGSGRYFFVLGPPIAMALAGLFRGDKGRVAVMVVCIAITTVGLVRMRDLPVSFVPDVDPLVAALDQADVEHVVAGFWLAYKLNWETAEEVVATPVQVNRYQPYTDEVRRADLVAYVYNEFDPSQVESAAAMRSALDSEGVRYVDLPVDGYTVLVPDQVVLPEDVPQSAVPTP